MLIVGARMAQAGTCTAAWTHPVAFELAPSTDHARQSLWFGHAGIIGNMIRHGGHVIGRQTILLMTVAIARPGIVV